MGSKEFHLKWERDEKFVLLEQLDVKYDEEVWERGVKLFKEALKTQPNNPEYLFRYGYLLERKANQLLREAAKCYQNGINSDLLKQDYAWISGKLHAQLIHVRAQLLENHKSIQFYKERLKANPNDPQNYFYLVQCYLKSDQVSEAGKVTAAGLKLFPAHAMLHYYNGEVLSRQEKTEAALQAWKKSAELDPQLIDGRFSRAYLFEREKRYQEAVQEWKLIIVFMEKYDFQDDFPKRELARIEKLMNG